MFIRKFYFKFAISLFLVILSICVILFGIFTIILLATNNISLLKIEVIIPFIILLVIGFFMLLLFAILLKKNQNIKTNYNKMIIGHFDKVYRYDEIVLLDIKKYIFYTYVIIKGNDKKTYRFFFDNKHEALEFIIRNDLQSLYKNYSKETFE